MTFTVQIGSGRVLFVMPGNGRFDQITRKPIPLVKAETK